MVVLNAGSHCIALNLDTFRQKRILNDYSGCFIHYALRRILYGKMLSKAGNETAGRRRADVRRSIVFRFLAGCTPAEMKIFLGLVFGPFNQFVTGSKYSFLIFSLGGGGGGGGCMQTIHFLLLLIFLFSGGVNADNSFSVLIFLFTGGGGGVNADNSFSVGFDFSFYVGGGGGGGGWIQTIHFLLVLIFLFTWGGGEGGRWMQTIHFLLEDRKFKRIHSHFVLPCHFVWELLHFTAIQIQGNKTMQIGMEWQEKNLNGMMLTHTGEIIL